MAFVQSASTDTAAAVAFGSAVGQGNALLAWVWCTSTGSATATCADSINTGNWSLLIGPVTNGTSTGWLFALNGTKAGTPTVTATLTGTILTNSIRIAEYSSVSGYDVLASGTSTASTTLTTSNLVTKFNVETIVASNFDPSSTTWSVGSGYTQRGTASATLGLILEDESFTTPGTYTATMTPLVSSTAIIIAVAFYAPLPVVWDEPTKLKSTMGALAIAGVAFAAPTMQITIATSSGWQEWGGKSVKASTPAAWDARLALDPLPFAPGQSFIEWAPSSKPTTSRFFARDEGALDDLSQGSALDHFVEWSPPSKPVGSPRAYALDASAAMDPIPFAPGQSLIEWAPSSKPVPPIRPIADAYFAPDPLAFAPGQSFIEWAPSSKPVFFKPVVLDANAFQDPIPFAPGQSFIEWAPSSVPFRSRFFANDQGALDDLTQGSALDFFVEWAPSSKPAGPVRPVVWDASAFQDPLAFAPGQSFIEWAPSSRPHFFNPYALDAAAYQDPLAFAPGQSFIEWAPSSFPRRYSAVVLDYLPTDALVLFPILKFEEWATLAKVVPVPRPSPLDAYVLDDSLAPPVLAGWNDWAPIQHVTAPPRLSALDAGAGFDPLPFAPGQSFIEWASTSKSLAAKSPMLDAYVSFDPLQSSAGFSFLDWAPSARAFASRTPSSFETYLASDPLAFAPGQSFIEWATSSKPLVGRASAYDAQVALDPIVVAGHSFIEWATSSGTARPVLRRAEDLNLGDPLGKPFLPSLAWFDWGPLHQYVPVWRKANDALPIDDVFVPPPPTEFLDWAAIPMRPFVLVRVVDASVQLIGAGAPSPPVLTTSAAGARGLARGQYMTGAEPRGTYVPTGRPVLPPLVPSGKKRW